MPGREARLLLVDAVHALFLRAGRDEDGSRSYRLQEGPPLATGYAADLYVRVFGTPEAV